MEKSYDGLKYAYGEKYAKDMETFDKVVLDIEKKYLDLLKSRPNSKNINGHDLLEYHYCFTNIGNKQGAMLGFEIFEDSDLPQYIKDELRTAHANVFGI